MEPRWIDLQFMPIRSVPIAHYWFWKRLINSISWKISQSGPYISQLDIPGFGIYSPFFDNGCSILEQQQLGFSMVT